MNQRSTREQGFIGLVVLITLVLVVTGTVVFIFLRNHNAPSSNFTSNSNQQSSSSNELILTGTVKQGPSRPVCSSSGDDCYQPVPNHSIQAIGSDDKVAGMTKTDSEGRYKLHLKPGHYLLELVPQADMYHIMNNEIDLGGSNHHLDLTLDSGIR